MKDSSMQEETAPQSIMDYIVDVGAGNTVVTDGPLGAQCAQALTEIYGKQDQPQIVMESQVNDLGAMVGIWQALRINGGASEALARNSAVIYSVNAKDVCAKDVARFNSIFSELDETNRAKSRLFLQVDGLSADQHSEYCQDLISAALRYNVKVCTHLASYVEDQLPQGARL